jgi:peptidoglycan/xylan/chitin deacetylase (PgdA/CDA1 family)
MNPALIGIPAVAAAAVTAYAAVNSRSQLFGENIFATGSPKQLAITFDDGPNPEITPRLLDLLDQYEAKATFFLIGRFVQECPALAEGIAERGHLIGNHTQTHPNLFWLTPGAIRREIEGCQKVLRGTLGVPAKYFRPPFGLRNPWVIKVAKELGMETVLWTKIPGDWRAESTEWLKSRMGGIEEDLKNSKLRRGDIICLHDGGHRGQGADRSCTLGALEYWLPRWRDMGAKFVTIAEAVDGPAT